MKKKPDIEKLWLSFGDIPVDVAERTDRKWHIFPKGTHRQDIWHWFEDQDKNFSVFEHLYGKRRRYEKNT